MEITLKVSSEELTGLIYRIWTATKNSGDDHEIMVNPKCIKVRRAALGHSQEWLAAQMGVDRTTVTKWETGRAFPKAKMLPRLAEVLQLSVEDFFRAG